ncbi:hypothetical protein [Corynebacterium renale]|uniref:hypothetical protein n=1 Tax=Corynebacterium renale TaxID=1724 RepID=UPI0015F1718C|nr:hypothetical protein [Corynebacterium renale]
MSSSCMLILRTSLVTGPEYSTLNVTVAWNVFTLLPMESTYAMAQDDTQYENWKYPVITHSSPQAFTQLKGYGDGIHAISLGESHLDILLRRRPGKNVLVVFGGAVDRTAGYPPFFSGVGLTSRLPFSLIALSDPAFTVDKQLRIGWYTGTRGEPAQHLIPQLIDAILEAWNKEKAVLLGGSAGGFAALVTAPQLRHSAEAFVMNPQTNVERYHHKHSVTAWAEVCKDPESGQILDLQKYYAGLPTQPRITYFQNKSDTHRGTHAEPFLESLETQPELVLGEWGDGHVPPPSSVLAAYLLPALLPTPAGALAQKIPAEQREKLTGLIHKVKK